jgi:opacity protein-like surface antigen
MKTIKAVTLTLAFISTFSIAQENKVKGPYIEGAYLATRYEEPALSFNHGSAAVRFGYNVDKNFAFELLGAANLDSASGKIGSTAITAQVASTTGLYLKAKAPITDELSIFGRLGRTYSKVSASSAYAKAGTEGAGWSTGLGVEYKISKNIYLGLDYMSYVNVNDIAITAPSVSIGYNF